MGYKGWGYGSARKVTGKRAFTKKEYAKSHIKKNIKGMSYEDYIKNRNKVIVKRKKRKSSGGFDPFKNFQGGTKNGIF